MTKYVDEKVVIAEHNRFIGYLDDDMIARLNIAIRRIPAADVKPIIRGEWKESKRITLFPNDIIWVCSVCGEYYRKHSPYCPHCGAEMYKNEELK